MGTICIEGMHFYSYHGFYEEEQKLGNSFYVDLIIDVDLNKSGSTDNLSDTINYGHLYKIVEDEMKIKSKLIENIGYRIIQRIKSDYPQINNVKVRVHKPNPPIHGKIENIYVELEG